MIGHAVLVWLGLWAASLAPTRVTPVNRIPGLPQKSAVVLNEFSSIDRFSVLCWSNPLATVSKLCPNAYQSLAKRLPMEADSRVLDRIAAIKIRISIEQITDEIVIADLDILVYNQIVEPITNRAYNVIIMRIGYQTAGDRLTCGLKLQEAIKQATEIIAKRFYSGRPNLIA